jgi:hypothetical protein
MIVGDLAAHLLTKEPITRLVGDAIYARRRPRTSNAKRYILLGRVSGSPQYGLTGEVGNTQTNIEVACWALADNGYALAEELAAVVRDQISGFRGEWSGTFINDCTLQSEPYDIEEAPADASDTWAFAVRMDYMVTHAQPEPSKGA